MPRYFFHVLNHPFQPDTEGAELPDIHAARAEAVVLCGEMIREIESEFWEAPFWRLQVTDDAQRLLFTLTFSAEEHAVPISV